MGRTIVCCWLAAFTFGFTATEAHELPPWAAAHMEHLVNDGGRWLADNSPHRSADELFDSYGTEWRWGIGRQSITGRLFGLRDGAEQGTFWEFRLFWHPGEGRLYLQQFGVDGTYGIGPVEQTGEGATRAVQQFYAPGGRRWATGHDTRQAQGTHETVSYDIGPGGEWAKRRTYLWRSTPPADG